MSTGGDFAAEVSWNIVQPLLAQQFPTKERLKIVEVGCGLGELSYLMQKAGHQVVAIDPAAEAIAATRSKGVADARQYGLEELARRREEQGTFDVVLFTRSLHHIGKNLEGVLRLVRDSLLRPDGVLVIEEFGREDINRYTAEWYYSLHDTLQAAGLVPLPRRHCPRHQQQNNESVHDQPAALEEDDKETAVKRLRKEQARDALDRWERQFKWRNHGMAGLSDLHLGHEMVSAIERVFGQLQVQRTSVLFRFIANHVDRQLASLPNIKTEEANNGGGGRQAYEITEAVWRHEEALIRHDTGGSLVPLGIVGVARKRQRAGSAADERRPNDQHSVQSC